MLDGRLRDMGKGFEDRFDREEREKKNIRGDIERAHAEIKIMGQMADAKERKEMEMGKEHMGMYVTGNDTHSFK